MHRVFKGFLGTYVLIGLLAACTSTKSPDAKAPLNPYTTLRIQHTGEPVSLDPSLAEDLLSFQILYNVYDGLFGYNKEGRLEPRLSGKFETSPDGKTYTFDLVKAKWSDGMDITADQFEYGLKRTLDPQTPAKLASFFSSLKDVRSQVDAKAGLNRLVIELKTPTPYLIQLLTLPLAFPQRKDQQGVPVEKQPTTGPYRVVRHDPEERYVLNLNSDYWRKSGTPAIQNIELLILKDDATAINLFEKGQVDVLTRFGPLEYKRLESLGNLLRGPFLATYYLMFNLHSPPFDRLEWRQAFAGAIQKQEISDVLGGGEIPAWGFIPPPLEGFDAWPGQQVYSKKFETGTKWARAHIETWPKEKPVVLQFDSNSRNSLILEKVQQDIKKGLGVELALEGLDWKTHIQRMQTNPASVMRFGWLSPFNDPMPFLEVALSSSRSNYMGYKNPRYDAAVEQARRLPPGPERAKWISEAQNFLIAKDVVMVPLIHYVQNNAVARRIEGYSANPYGLITFYDVRIKR